MANSNDPIWKAYKHRTLNDLIRFDPTPEPTAGAIEFGDESGLEDRHMAIPDPSEVNIYLHWHTITSYLLVIN